MRLDHIGIAVENLENALKIYSETLGFKLIKIMELPNEGMKIAILNSGNTELELIEPLREDTAVGKFLNKRGSGIHHICFSVPRFDAKIEDLEAKGLHPVAPPTAGVKGKRVVFFSPKKTMGTLIEICEESGE